MMRFKVWHAALRSALSEFTNLFTGVQRAKYGI